MGHKQHTFRSILAVAEFRALWGAEALSQMGDQLARVALAVLVFERTDSAALTGLTYALTFAPAFLGGIFLSGLADRRPRRDVMVASDLSRAALIGLVAIPDIPFAGVCLLVAGVSFLQAPFKAAQLALLPTILPDDRFEVGMGLRTATMQVAQLVGFAAGGLLVEALDPHVALAADALTFGASATLVRLGLRRRPAAQLPASQPSFARSLVVGSTFMARDRRLRIPLLFAWLTAVLIVYEGLAAPYTDEIGGGPTAVGLLLASDPFGSALGAVAFGRWIPPSARPRTMGWFAIANSALLLVCFAQPGILASAAMFTVGGALGTAVLLQATVSYTRAVPDDSRGQIIGLGQAGLASIQGITPLLAGVLADRVGATDTVGVVGVAGLLVAVPTTLAWRRHLNTLDTGNQGGPQAVAAATTKGSQP